MTFGSTGGPARRPDWERREEEAMTVSSRGESSARTHRDGSASRALAREVWATVAIVSMWVAVLFVGVYGGEATFRSVDSSVTTVPAGVFVALFAAFGTGSVAKRVWGRASD
jgi:hypothetical protein